MAKNIRISGTQATKMWTELPYYMVQWQEYVLQVNTFHVQKQAMFFTTSYWHSAQRGPIIFCSPWSCYLFIYLYVVYLMTCQYLGLYSVKWLENNKLGKTLEGSGWGIIWRSIPVLASFKLGTTRIKSSFVTISAAMFSSQWFST
jgi:hypothetical protein